MRNGHYAHCSFRFALFDTLKHLPLWPLTLGQFPLWEEERCWPFSQLPLQFGQEQMTWSCPVASKGSIIEFWEKLWLTERKPREERPFLLVTGTTGWKAAGNCFCWHEEKHNAEKKDGPIVSLLWFGSLKGQFLSASSILNCVSCYLKPWETQLLLE